MHKKKTLHRLVARLAGKNTAERGEGDERRPAVGESRLAGTPPTRHRTLVRYVSDFFFSSRRRHTRWPRDWSSDVCSSDLMLSVAGQMKVFQNEDGTLSV